MNRLNQRCGLLLLCIFLMPTMGCKSRFVSGFRKLFVGSGQPVATATKPVSETVNPVVAIDDGAGDDSSSGDVISPELAARYREMLLWKPNDPVVHYNLGRLYLQEGLLEEATVEFDRATSLDPQFTYAFIMLGRTLRMRRLYDLALAKLAVAMKLQPDLPVSYLDAGICWDQRGYYEQAREQYLKALQLSPGDPQIYNNIGYSYFLEGEYRSAIKFYQKGLELSPTDPYLNNNLALAYAVLKEWDKALKHFRQAVGESAAQNNIGLMLLRAGRLDQAIAHLERAVRLAPDSVQALANLESALRLKGMYTDAERIHADLVAAQNAASIPSSREAAGTARPPL